jgi:GDP-D-mannose dehydratase
MKNKNKNITIIITGAMGQDGIILSKILIKKKFQVIGIIKKKKYKNLVKGVKYIYLDLLKRNHIINTLRLYNPKYLIHFGSNNPSYVDKNSVLYGKINKKQSFNIINAIKDHCPNCIFIFSNSSQIYKKNISKVKENSKFTKNNSYILFRIAVYKYLKFLKKRKNFKFINLILFNHDSIYRNKKFLIPRLIKSSKTKNMKFIKSIYQENIAGDFSHAHEICKAIYLLIKKKIIINDLILSSGKLTYVNDIIKYILPKKKYELLKNIKVKKNYYNSPGDNKLAKKKLNWSIKKNIFDAVKEMKTIF